MRRSIRHAVYFPTLAAVLALIPSRALAADEPFAITGVRVFDGARVIPDATVVVRDGTIGAVGADVPVPAGTTIIDGRGKTLLPGLIDAHTHTFAPEHLRAAVVFGVTTEMDMFTLASFAQARRAEQAAGNADDRADLFSAGTLVTAPGGHGTEYGLPIPTIKAPGEAENFVAARIAEGSDYIKIVFDDGKQFNLPSKTLDEPTLTAVIRAAKAQKKLAVVHIMAREFARQAVAAGADGLVHLFVDMPVDDAFVRLAADRKVFVIPTLTVLESVNRVGGGAALALDPHLEPFLAPEELQSLTASFPGKTAAPEVRKIPGDAVKRLKAAGVRILAGTDCDNPGTAHGASIHRELSLLVAAGLSPREALAAATSETALAFGLSDRGRIAPGCRADFLLVEGDPTEDITNTRRISGVWKRGHRIDRDAYRRTIRERIVAAAKLRNAPAPPGSERGLISDFEGETAATKTAFGAGWMISTDALRGGKSKGETAIVEGGANGSARSLRVKGTIEDSSGQHWAGILFSPGPRSLSPANLSSKSGISFWARGAGKPLYVMVFSQSRGFTPAIKEFVAPGEWKQFQFDWKDFEGFDGNALLGIFWGAGAQAGPFEFEIDDVHLMPAPAK